MPKEKKYLSLINNIYKSNYEDIGMFFFVEAQRQIVPAVTIEQSIVNYFRYLNTDDYNIESSMTTYTRLKHKFFESLKSNEDSKTHR